MKIGIFMAYRPGILSPDEGLGRYVGNLIKGLTQAGHTVSIASPRWSLDALEKLLEDFSLPMEEVEIVTGQKLPVLWRMLERRKRKGRVRESRRLRLYRDAANAIEWIVAGALNITSVIVFTLLTVLAVLLGIALLPVALVALLVYCILKLLYALAKKGKFPLKGLKNKGLRLYASFSTRGETIQKFFMDKLYEIVVDQLIKKVNRTDAEVWFVPSLFWPEVADIKATTVINAPDMVTMEFPMGFAIYPEAANATDTCARTLEEGRYFITYCEYLKQELVMRRFGKPETHVCAIPHINNSMREYIDIDVQENNRLNYDGDLSMSYARLLLSQLTPYSGEAAYLQKFDFEHIEYIFYPSQLRPSKNILSLIRAYEYLLRKRYVQVKLFLTCTLEVMETVHAYVRDHGLQFDVLTFRHVPAEHLAALYKCASLVVNPTLYEGGFLSFTLGEGMSVGTPSIMSRIPQVTEVTDAMGLDDILFDPYDYMDMAEKIEYWLNHLEELYEKELPLYRQIESRTGAVVANEYVAAFQHFITLDQQAKSQQLSCENKNYFFEER